ncbi:MAG: M42 family metallopeptidase [Fusobacteriaceae bacterium]
MKNIDMEYVLDFTKEILAIPSVTGFTDEASARIASELDKFGVKYSYTNKGAVVAEISGADNSTAKMITAHIDTLGGIVKRIKSNGRLELVNMGGINWAGVEAENLTVHAFNGEKYSGSLIPMKSSVHTYGEEAREIVRTSETIEVRLDENVSSALDTEKLGIKIGDCVSFDTRTVITKSGYIKSRYLDDKICVAQLFGYIKYLSENNLKPANKLYLYFANFEEIGHGISVFPEDVLELVSLDVGLVAPDAMGDERKVAITMKDSRTIYDVKMNKKLIELADKNSIKYTLDIYNKYGSDASSAVLQGKDLRIACIGPSVEASHHYERTHVDGVLETIKLLIAYFAQ